MTLVGEDDGLHLVAVRSLQGAQSRAKGLGVFDHLAVVRRRLGFRHGFEEAEGPFVRRLLKSADIDEESWCDVARADLC